MAGYSLKYRDKEGGEEGIVNNNYNLWIVFIEFCHEFVIIVCYYVFSISQFISFSLVRNRWKHNLLSFMKKMFFWISLVIGNLLLWYEIASATNYVLGNSSVDSSGWVKEIRYDGSTTYSTQFVNAVSTWNARWKVNIAPDIWSTIEDLTITDVNNSNVTYTWRWTSRIGADLLELNTYFLSNNTNNQRQNTITHELGHALGIAHNPMSTNIMYYAQTSLIALWTQDIADYIFLYGN